MSLIMDALKKVQQQRAREARGTPFLKKEGRKIGSRKNRWVIITTSVVGFSVLLAVLWWIFRSPSAPSPHQTFTMGEQKPLLLEPPPVQLHEANRKIMKPTPEEESKSLPSETRLALPISLKEANPTGEKEKRESVSTKPSFEMEKTHWVKREERLIKESEEPKKTSPSSPKILPKSDPPSPPVALVEAVTKDDPHGLEAIRQFNLGVTLYQQREMAKAIQAYQRVLELNPNDVEAYVNLGVIYQEMGDLEKALQSYQKAVEIKPNYAKGLNNLGILLHLRGEDEKAMEAFQKALAIDPHHVESHINLGTLYKRKGALDRAVESYQKALTINPRHGEGHYNLGLLYEQMGNVDKAVPHYEQFIHLCSATHPELASKIRRHLQQLRKTKR